MYKRFFGLRENPFNLNPDPRYLFLNPQTRSALDQLTYGIQARKGLIVFTGEVGTGKTTVINRLREWLDQRRTPTAFIFNSHLEASHLFDCMLEDFGAPPAPELNGKPLVRLTHWLMHRNRAGDVPVLIVDEAQGLPLPVLEQIRQLLNMEMPDQVLLQIVLVGQPELDATLNRREARQIKQRIAFWCKTEPLSLKETQEYVLARLHVAGASGKPIFSPESLRAVHFYSRGIPRIINLLCEHALINAYADDVHLVPAQTIKEIAHEFQYDDRPLPSPDIAAGAVPLYSSSRAHIPEASSIMDRHARAEVSNGEAPNGVLHLTPSVMPHVSASLESSNQPCAAPPELGLPVLHPTIVPRASGIEAARFDGREDASRIEEINVASSRDLVRELMTGGTVPHPTSRVSAVRPAAGVGKKIEVVPDTFRQDWLRMRTHLLDHLDRGLDRLTADVTRAALGTYVFARLFVGWTAPVNGPAGSETANRLRAATDSVVFWLKQPMAAGQQKGRSGGHPAGDREASLARDTRVSRRARRVWQALQDQYRPLAPAADYSLRVSAPLLRWLRAPMHPSPLRPAGRRPAPTGD